MKIYLSKSYTDRKGFTWVGDMGALDSVASACEATGIVVDNFFASFHFSVLGELIENILAKLRINGVITFYQLDIDILSHQYSRMNMDIKQYNDAMFHSGPIASTLNMESLCGLLTAANLTIETKEVNYETCQAIITARRTP